MSISHSGENFEHHVVKRKRKKRKEPQADEKKAESADEQMPESSDTETCMLYSLKGESKRKKQVDWLLKGTTFKVTESLIQKMKNLHINIDWELPPLHTGILGLLNKEQVDLIKEATGVTQSTARWSFKELKIIAENWKRFREQYEITNPLLLLGLRKVRGVSVRQNLNFARYMARGLDRRQLILVYHQCRRIFDPGNYKGSLSKTEFRLLQRYRLKYGNKWTKIGRKMKRSAELLHYISQAKSDKFRNGQWSSKENKRLIRAIRHFTGSEDLSRIDTSRLSWKDVSLAVKTRNVFQCRTHWLYTLSIDINFSLLQKFQRFSRRNKIKLLERIEQGNYESEVEIPWAELNEEFKLPAVLRLKTQYFNMRLRVPNHYIKTHEEIIEWLVKNYLPELRRKLSEKSHSSKPDK